MDMSTFWSTVGPKLNISQLGVKYPGAVPAMEAEDMDPEAAEFAYDVIPNIGPGGATTDEDQVDLDERDPDQEIVEPDGPSLSGQQELMAYFSNIDELWCWKPGDDGHWSLWNY